jgi:hypothetical protein
VTGSHVQEPASRFWLDEDAPNNAVIRHYGVFDHVEDDYATTPTGDYCYGMTHAEAVAALEALRD